MNFCIFYAVNTMAVIFVFLCLTYQTKLKDKYKILDFRKDDIEIKKNYIHNYWFIRLLTKILFIYWIFSPVIYLLLTIYEI